MLDWLHFNPGGSLLGESTQDSDCTVTLIKTVAERGWRSRGGRLCSLLLLLLLSLLSLSLPAKS